MRLPVAKELCVIQILEQIIEWRGKPAMIRFDNGSKYIIN